MATKAELEKQNKELKALVRKMKTDIKTSQAVEADLPIDSITFFKEEESRKVFMYDVKFNPQTNDIMIVGKTDLGKDTAVSLFKVKKAVVSLLLRNKKEI